MFGSAIISTLSQLIRKTWRIGLTQNTSLQVEQDPRITDVHRTEEDFEWERMRDGLSAVQQDQQ